MTLIVVTHDPRVGALAQRQIRLEKGKLIERGKEVSVVGGESYGRRA
jgi:predicted ABC-type transport system involved in lysophospholipase L1 biosynthesis ATPase subunit